MSKQTYRPTIKEFLFNGQSLDAPVHIVDEGESRTRHDCIFKGTVEEITESEYANYHIDAWNARYNGVKVIIEIVIFAERERRLAKNK